MKSVKKEIYLVVCYSFGDMREVFKAYESKEMAKEVVKIKQKEFRNSFWEVMPIHLVQKEQRET